MANLKNGQNLNSELREKVHSEMTERYKLIKELFERHPTLQEILEKRTYIAGGAIRSSILDEKINDVDVFFYDQESLEYFLEAVTVEGFSLPKKWRMKKTINSLSFHYENSIYPTIQFIKLHTGMPSKMIEEFDFTCNMNFFIPSSHYLHVEDIEAIETRLLYVNISNCSVVNTFYRIFKFMEQGWGINGESLANMTILLSGLDEIESHDEVRDYLLMGMSQVEFNFGGKK